MIELSIIRAFLVNLMKNYYDVDYILDKDISRGFPLYLVKWYGYPLDQATWEPETNLINVKEMISEFEGKTCNIMKSNEKQSSNKKEKRKDDNSKDQIEVQILEPSRYSDEHKLQINYTANSNYDIPLKIKNISRQDKTIQCEVKWKTRPNGIRPNDSKMNFKEVKEKYPMHLIDYLESKNIKLD